MSMGVLVNHAVSFVTSPLFVSLAFIIAGVVALARTLRRMAGRGDGTFCGNPFAAAMGFWLALVGIVWLWFMSSGLAFHWLGMSLEGEFPPQRVEELPTADAIVILGGGMGGDTNTVCYSELYPGADRVAHAARIWKAGKAPVIIVSGTNEFVATLPFLLELGVPRDVIHVENKSGNTEENARFVASFAKECGGGKAGGGVGRTKAGPESAPKVLLVTSSWHMRRALLMFRKYAQGIEVIPAACDYEATIGSGEFRFWKSLLPNADSLSHNSCMLKEIIGYWGYRLLR